MVYETPTTPNTMRQIMFLEGAKDLVLNHNPFPNKEQTLLIILFTGIIDEDLERVRWALDNGADANASIQPWAENIIRAMGWSCAIFATALSTVSAPESGQTLPQCVEPGPDSEASQ